MLNDVKLKRCCYNALDEINKKMKWADALKAIVVTSPFITMFGGSPIEIGYTVVSTDWNTLTKAAMSANRIAAHTCKIIAFDEIRRHAGGSPNESKLNDYWKHIYDIICNI